MAGDPTFGPVCLSGGAEGADLQWGMTAGMAGHTVVHFNFKGHKCKAPKSEQVCLTPAQLEEADPALIRANETLQRSFPTSSHFVNSLLRRNFWQAKDTQAIYAIAGLDPKGGIYGGTAWASQVFIDRFNDEGPIPLYVFDQEQDGWFHYYGGGAWVRIESPPAPGTEHEIWTGIGTRDLKDNGKAEIRRLLNYVPSETPK